MISNARRSLTPALVAASLVSVIWCWYFFSVPSGFFFTSAGHQVVNSERIVAALNVKDSNFEGFISEDSIPLLPAQEPTANSKEDDTFDFESFVAEQTDFELPGWDPRPLRELCDATEWNEDLVLTVGNHIIGGLHNVRQYFIHSVRMAIAFGADIILPQIRHRQASTDGPVHSYDKKSDGMEYMFDRDIFISRLKEACPQMKVREAMKSDHYTTIGNFERVKIPTQADMSNVTRQWLSEHPIATNTTSLINFMRQAWQYPICEDGAAIANTLGTMVAYRADTRRLAAVVLYELVKKYSLHDATQADTSSFGFLGIHLRTDADTVTWKWMSYEVQSTAYHKHLDTYSLPVAYIATGDQEHLKNFTALIAPIPVATKYALLEDRPIELAELQSLTWDQQAQVDHLVLLRARKFLGTTESSFSWAIAGARRASSKDGTCGGPNMDGIVGYKKGDGKDDIGIAFEDQTSLIIGKAHHEFGNYTWP